jgi:hypothetical protein
MGLNMGLNRVANLLKKSVSPNAKTAPQKSPHAVPGSAQVFAGERPDNGKPAPRM